MRLPEPVRPPTLMLAIILLYTTTALSQLHRSHQPRSLPQLEDFEKRNAVLEPDIDVKIETVWQTATTVEWITEVATVMQVQSPAPSVVGMGGEVVSDGSDDGGRGDGDTSGERTQSGGWSFSVAWTWTSSAPASPSSSPSTPTSSPAVAASPTTITPLPALSATTTSKTSQQPSSAPSSPPPPPPPPPPPAPKTNNDPLCASENTLQPWQKAVLDAHNDVRARHPIDPQCWHDGLAAAAGMAASLCGWAHTLTTGKDICGFSQGFMQNYAATSSSSSSPTDLSSTTTWIDSVKESWYASEEAHYASDGDYDRSDPLPPPKDGMGNPAYETGHFSAMVWKSSTYVGCAQQYCPNGISGMSSSGGTTFKYFLVCDYALPGNMAGEYRQEVLRPMVGS